MNKLPRTMTLDTVHVLVALMNALQNAPLCVVILIE